MNSPKIVQKEQATQQEEAAQVNEEQGQEGEKKLSKNELKKLEKQKKKDEEKKLKDEAKKQQQDEEEKKQEADTSIGMYGDYELIQSQEKTDRKWVKVINITEQLLGQTILVRARLHNVRAKSSKLGFLILREDFSTAQVVYSKSETVSAQMTKWISKLPCESIVDIYAQVTNPQQPIISCSQKQELVLQKIFVVSRSRAELPFQLEDASRRILTEQTIYDEEEEEKQQQQQSTQNDKDGKEKKDIKVFMKTRLDNRILDLRTTAKQAIFRVSSGICQLFREFLYKNDFMEIHTPKLIEGTSEGGANVFKLNYFGKQACLAQSPQLYKQMCVMSDFKRVFEIGPVFRAEQSFTHRHMCEFTGLDLEMEIKENYFELMDIMSDLFVYIFQGIETRYAQELAAINDQFPFEPFKCPIPTVKLTFEEGIQLLKTHANVEWSAHEDLDTPTERKLGEVVKNLYGTDFYMLHRYPISARPFYTMVCKDDPKYTLSYDFFMRGEEITSGAQRNHDPDSLAQRAASMGIEISTIKDYIDSFRYGAYPHGGCGIGLERVLFLYCNLKNIRNGCLFPRDPRRIRP